MKPQTWFRLYNEVVDDPKVQTLSPALFRAWVNLLCVASKNRGSLPSVADISYRLRVTESKAESFVDDLLKVGLFEKLDDAIVPHNWDGRQFKSDVSTERVKRFRNGERNVSETDSETFPPDTDIADKQTDPPKPPRGLDDYSPEFESFWRLYPKKRGKGAAWGEWKKIKPSVELQLHMSVAINAAKKSSQWRKDGGEYIPNPATWLHRRCWDDEQALNGELVSLRPTGVVL